MKHTTPQGGRIGRSARRVQTAVFNQTILLGSLTVVLFLYIVYYLFYPLIVKGLLW